MLKTELPDESVERWISKRTLLLVDEVHVCLQPLSYSVAIRVGAVSFTRPCRAYNAVLMTELSDESVERWISNRTVRLVDEVYMLKSRCFSATAVVQSRLESWSH